ncbi:uncharacterized protein LOC9632323 [Selaginella moellendorffii]|uniref:uncharacterized protein LOC9632323 n=1 Tax=Selaginella moellendorffii TaxID=88036 RepID=UPI000D1C2F9B|nr:uncharacterized protein LOC9632323 [Selaginella moellendorffii]|eukprot:XP_002967086.2 uncharacterized protein LOC9632323 [Selaginella moellendorffii]
MGVLKDLLASGALESKANAPARAPLKILNGPGVVDIKPRFVHNLSACQGWGADSDAKLGTFPTKIEIGTVGSCLDAQSQWQRRTRRPKQPTVIVRPSVLPEDEKPQEPVPPSGVLGELKPGIIGRVHDSKYVHSAIGAVLKSGTLVRKRCREFADENRGVAKPTVVACKQVKRERPEANLEEMLTFTEALESLENRATNDSEVATSVEDFSCGTLEGSRSKTESWDVTIDKLVDDEQDDDHHSMTQSDAMIQKQSGPAAIWLKLVNQDIKGRISALKRSRRRVRTAIVAKDDIFMPADKSSFLDLSRHEDPAKAKRQYELQMDKWKALFLTMDHALGAEAAQLDSQWKSLQELRCSCNTQQHG